MTNEATDPTSTDPKPEYVEELSRLAEKLKSTTQTTWRSNRSKGKSGSGDSGESLDLDSLVRDFPTDISSNGTETKNRMVLHGTNPYNAELEAKIVGQLAEAGEAVNELSRALAAGSTLNFNELLEVAEPGKENLLADADIVMSSALQAAVELPLTERAVRLSILSMMMGIEAGFDEENVTLVGLAAMVHDFGLFTPDSIIRDFHSPIPAKAVQNYREHPKRTAEILSRIRAMPDVVRIAAYQVHERPDGSGFPARTSEARIHAFAKLIGVADDYISLTTMGRGRPPLVAHDAVMTLLHSVHFKKRDGDAVRNLLRVLSVYPLGTNAVLSNGRECVVARRNGEFFTDPVVRYHDAAPEDQLVDLKEHKLKIERVLYNPNSQMRLSRSMIGELAGQISEEL